VRAENIFRYIAGLNLTEINFTSKADPVNSSRKKRKTAAGNTKLRKAAAKELSKKSGSLTKTMMDYPASEELKNIQFLCDLAGDSTAPDEGGRERRSIALDLAAEPPWQPLSGEDTETGGGLPEEGHAEHS
jgi:hypothetical protein